jgi:hypothetical protein
MVEIEEELGSDLWHQITPLMDQVVAIELQVEWIRQELVKRGAEPQSVLLVGDEIFSDDW